MSLIYRLVVGLFVLAWAGGLIWYGWDLLSTSEPHFQNGGFTLVACGMLLLVPTVVGLVYSLLKSRAPAKRSERPTEPAEVTFDPDAAIARYLALKKTQGATFAEVQREAASARPVFGRRGNPA